MGFLAHASCAKTVKSHVSRYWLFPLHMNVHFLWNKNQGKTQFEVYRCDESISYCYYRVLLIIGKSNLCTYIMVIFFPLFESIWT